MAERISNNTILVLIILAGIISVLSITLSMMTFNNISGITQTQQGAVQDTGGVISVKVPSQPSEMGAQVILEVVENSS